MEEFIGILVEAIFSILGVVIAGAIAYFIPKIKRRFEILADKDNTNIIETVGEIAVEIAEKELTGKSGEEKFDRAMGYASVILQRYGVDVSSEFLAGSLQKGWRKLDTQQKKVE